MMVPFCADAAPAIWEVILLGMGTVFAGIAAIIVICKLLSLFSRGGKNKKEENKPAGDEEAQIGGEVAAVIGAAVAEELGTDISAIKIVSVKKVKR